MTSRPTWRIALQNSMQNIWSWQWRLRSRIFPSQWVNSMPSLLYHNCFSVLPTCSINETVEPSIDVQNPVSESPIIVLTEIAWNRHPKWEQWLPSKLVIASAEDSSTSLKLKVELETTDTGEVKSVNSFVDSGATGEFIDHYYAKSNQLHTWKLSKPLPVYNVDRTLNGAGSITEVVDLILRYRNHLEQTLFAVTGLGKQKLTLGHSWLWKHNLAINWATGDEHGCTLHYVFHLFIVPLPLFAYWLVVALSFTHAQNMHTCKIWVLSCPLSFPYYSTSRMHSPHSYHSNTYLPSRIHLL